MTWSQKKKNERKGNPLKSSSETKKYDRIVAKAISSKGENRSIPDKMARKEIRQTKRATSQNKKQEETAKPRNRRVQPTS